MNILTSVLALPEDQQHIIAATILANVDPRKGLPPELYKIIPRLGWRWNVEIVISRRFDFGEEVLLFPIPLQHAFYAPGQLHVPGMYPQGTEDNSVGRIITRIAEKYKLPPELYSRYGGPRFRDIWPNIGTKPGPTLHLIHRLTIFGEEEVMIPDNARWVLMSNLKNEVLLSFHHEIIKRSA